MLKNIKTLLITVFTVVVLLTNTIALPLYTVQVSAQGTECSVDSIDPNCNPPKLKDFQTYLANLLAVVWAAGGVIFLAMMIGIGFRYMTGAGHPDKEADAKGRAGKWVLGIFLLYFSRIFVATIMESLIADNTDCYEDLNQPVIQFFFADVCTDGDAVLPGVAEECNPSDTPPCSGGYSCNWEGALGIHICQ